MDSKGRILVTVTASKLRGQCSTFPTNGTQHVAQRSNHGNSVRMAYGLALMKLAHLTLGAAGTATKQLNCVRGKGMCPKSHCRISARTQLSKATAMGTTFAIMLPCQEDSHHKSELGPHPVD